jgi:CheY-like chemotaxis protein
MKVLVVEDDPLVREVAVEALIAEGFGVIEAATGEEAIKHCSADRVDLIFTDIRLPGKITGWDIAEHCRGANPTIPVIYATGYSHVQPRPVSGSVSLYKPYRPSQIVDAIYTLMHSKRE